MLRLSRHGLVHPCPHVAGHFLCLPALMTQHIHTCGCHAFHLYAHTYTQIALSLVSPSAAMVLWCLRSISHRCVLLVCLVMWCACRDCHHTQRDRETERDRESWQLHSLSAGWLYAWTHTHTHISVDTSHRRGF
mmetsp:Transcript_35400/g.87986  ORF Transcript_35400/g.87986 Transcript_35400/m.87986 type:complete len:134 (-) Transcript_35400:121-522(-)